jgi:oligoendopeptidase F
MTQERSSVPVEDRWNVEALYPSLEEWEKDLTRWGREGQSLKWPEIAQFKGKLAQGPAELKALLEVCFEIERHLSKVYTYAHLRHDEDVANEVYKKAHARSVALLYDFRQETSWIEPEILELKAPLLQAEILKDYKIYLEKIFHLKPHTLSGDKEELLALAGKALEASQRSFSAFNNADIKFAPVTDSSGQQRELTHGKYQLYLRDPDRKVREGAFKNLHRSFSAYENTLCELINGQVQGHVFQMRARGYKSCLEAALFPHEIDTQVYKSLIQTVRSRLGSLHRYMKVRKKILGLDSLHPYDLYVPLVPEAEISMSYADAENLVIESVALLGPEYKKDLEKGLKTERWVDRYENAHKRSGAYSSGCYDSMPYILMNYHGTFNDMKTLTHEAGHSMHSLFSKRHQPYHYSQYAIFVAEVASTFHEGLLQNHLISKLDNPEQKRFLINQQIEDIRATFFRQTMFAEFELRLHEWAEQGVPLTPALLKQEYRKLNEDYFGPDVVLDEEINIEWARIPHFYYNFYVYQYATGLSAAHALIDRVQSGGDSALKRYLTFLSSGSSRYPLELLKDAGVDMTKQEAIHALIDHFDQLVGEL